MDIIEFNQQIWEPVRSILYGIESIVRAQTVWDHHAKMGVG